MSLIEQIKKKASLLAETKMIDKVSISSSNYDDYDLNHMNCNASVQLDSQSINEQDGGAGGESGESLNRLMFHEGGGGNSGDFQQAALKFNEYESKF